VSHILKHVTENAQQKVSLICISSIQKIATKDTKTSTNQ